MARINVDGLNVVVTGKIAGESRQTAEAKLRDAGAHVHPSVTGTTHLLVMGASVGATKVNAAKARGAKAVRWEDVALDGSGDELTDDEDLDRCSNGCVCEDVPLRERPAQIAPMLCKDAEGALPTGEGWLYEVKWDGLRAVATIKDHTVSLQSRSGKSEYAERFPQIVKALEGLDDCVIDGEIVVLDDAGASSFQAITGSSNGGVARYVVFDVLEAFGEDKRKEPLWMRKEILGDIVNGRHVDETYVTCSPTFDDGAKLLEVARERGLEGIVCKKSASTYKEGAKGPDWLKFKLRCEQEFVVVGWQPGNGRKAGIIGSLVLAVRDDSSGEKSANFILAGACGTGNDAESKRMLAQLQDLECENPSAQLKLTGRERKEARRDGVVWVHPVVVVVAQFQRWTEDGRLWHPSYQGQRYDKDPDGVRREPCAA